MNFHRYLWENEAETKLLTPASGISVQRDWGVREFPLSDGGALTGRLALKMGQSAASKDELLTEVSALSGVLVRESPNLSGGISVLGSRATGGKRVRRPLVVACGGASTEHHSVCPPCRLGNRS